MEYQDQNLIFLFKVCCLTQRSDNGSFWYQRYISSFASVSFQLFYQPAPIANLTIPLLKVVGTTQLGHLASLSDSYKESVLPVSRYDRNKQDTI